MILCLNCNNPCIRITSEEEIKNREISHSILLRRTMGKLNRHQNFKSSSLFVHSIYGTCNNDDDDYLINNEVKETF